MSKQRVYPPRRFDEDELEQRVEAMMPKWRAQFARSADLQRRFSNEEAYLTACKRAELKRLVRRGFHTR